MQEDPYSGLIGMMQKEGAKLNPPSIKVGIIISSEPLHIKVDDQDIYEDDVLVADYLLGDYKREMTFNTNGDLTSTTQSTSGGGGYAEFASHSHAIGAKATYIGEGEIILKPYLKKDDLLALMPMMGEQQYIVLARVVKMA